MFLKVILLCCFCVLFVNPSSVPKKRSREVLHCAPGTECQAKGGHCILRSDRCPGRKLGSNACPGSGCICCIKKKKHRNGKQNRNLKVCKQKSSCRQAGGRCIGARKPCGGKVKENACHNKCQCCISKPKGAKRRGKNFSKSGKEDKNEKGCKKKKKCKGFCINKDEECDGEIDPKGCKGKHCSCCTQGDKEKEKDIGESSPSFEYDYYDYSGYPEYMEYYYPGYDYSDYGCYGKNVNGSCEDRGCFICGDGECQPQDFKCDDFPDCNDGSDELGCPRPMPDWCPKYYKWVLRSCYQVVARSSSWPVARMVCQALNGEMAHIYDHKHFTEYMKAFQESIQAVYWVGIHRVDGAFTWMNGTLLPENSTLWGSTGAPAADTEGEGCVVLDLTDNALHTISCGVDTYNNKSIYSVCEYVDNGFDYYILTA